MPHDGSARKPLTVREMWTALVDLLRGTSADPVPPTVADVVRANHDALHLKLSSTALVCNHCGEIIHGPVLEFRATDPEGDPYNLIGRPSYPWHFCCIDHLISAICAESDADPADV